MTTALIVIDMQRLMQQRIDAGRDCVNPDAAVRIGTPPRRFRRRGRPVVHVRHRDDDPSSPPHPDADAHGPMPEAQAEGGELVVFKRTSSAFASRDRERHLRDAGVTQMIVTGAVAGFCLNSTVRAGADLGFRMTVVRDAFVGFDLPDAGLSARTIFDVTMAHLEADFAQMVTTAAMLEPAHG